MNESLRQQLICHRVGFSFDLSAFVCVFLWCFIAALVAATPQAAVGAERVNVVLIMADDLGYGDIGCYGSERIKTPHLDALAKSGVRLTDFHSNGAVCSPTRAALVTGRYQQRAGVPSVIVADPKRPTHPHGLHDREVTVAERFSKAGYKTAIFGKWHLGYYKKYNPVRHGFGEFRGYISGNVDFFSHVDQAGRLDWWRDDAIKDEPGYVTHLITKHAVSFINQHADAPFCIYIPHEAPHYPYQGPNDKAVRAVGKPRGPAETRQSAQDVARAYKEMVEEMDKGVGEVVAALKKHGIAERTLVIFCSDNGANNRGDNGPLRGRKGQVWEGGHRVPGIVSWPGKIKPNQTSDVTAMSMDLTATILAAAGIDPPKQRKLDGVNLLPALIDGESLPDRTLFWASGGQRAVRDGQWKLVKNAPGQKQPGLFDLSKDIGEKNDLAKDHPQRVEAMHKALAAWEIDVHADVSPQPDEPPAE